MSTYRVTNKSLGLEVMSNLQTSLGRMQRIQEQLSSGRALQRPSDSPTGTVSALRIRAETRRNEQLLRNADDGIAWLGTADRALTDMLGVVGRVRELVLRGANGTAGPEAREAIAAEVDALRQQALSLANTTYLDRPVFGGTSDVARAYDTTGAYAGDAGAVERTVAEGLRVPVALNGPEAFGPAGADLFATMDDIAQHLRSGDTATLTGTDLAALDTARVRIQNALATVGARYHHVEAMRDRTDQALIDLANRLSEVESVDLPKTIVDMQMQEVAYKAALSATSRVLQPSLLDFLR